MPAVGRDVRQKADRGKDVPVTRGNNGSNVVLEELDGSCIFGILLVCIVLEGKVLMWWF